MGLPWAKVVAAYPGRQERQERRCQEAWALPEMMVLLEAPAIHKAVVGMAHRVRLAVEFHPEALHPKAPRAEETLTRKVRTEWVQWREAVVALLEMVDWREGQAQLVARVPSPSFLAVVVPLDWKGQTVPWVPMGVPS